MALKSGEGFLGGPWQQVLLKLVIISAVIGFLMVTFGLEPASMMRNLALFGQRIMETLAFSGLDMLITVGKYCLYGAIIVVPIWLVSRIFAATRKP